MIKDNAVTLSVASGFVIVGGVIFAILMGVMEDDLLSSLWALGFLYILPGILGLIAGFINKRLIYIIALAFNILFLLAMFVVMVLLGLAMPHATEPCSRDSCNQKSRNIYIAMYVFVVITWIALFTAVIICSYNVCDGETAIPSVVMQSGPQINVSVSQTSQQQNSQLNPTPVNTVPAYGGPQYGPYWYGAPNGQTGYSAPNGQNVNGASPAGQNGYDAPAGQRAHGGDQQNTSATDTASAVEVHPLQDITQTNN